MNLFFTRPEFKMVIEGIQRSHVPNVPAMGTFIVITMIHGRACTDQIYNTYPSNVFQPPCEDDSITLISRQNRRIRKMSLRRSSSDHVD